MLCVRMHCLCEFTFTEVRRGHQIPGTEVTGGCECPCGHADLFYSFSCHVSPPRAQNFLSLVVNKVECTLEPWFAFVCFVLFLKQGTKLFLYSQSPRFQLLSTGITGIYCHSWLHFYC